MAAIASQEFVVCHAVRCMCAGRDDEDLSVGYRDSLRLTHRSGHVTGTLKEVEGSDGLP
jgi:hypothetical protein